MCTGGSTLGLQSAEPTANLAGTLSWPFDCSDEYKVLALYLTNNYH